MSANKVTQKESCNNPRQHQLNQVFPLLPLNHLLQLLKQQDKRNNKNIFNPQSSIIEKKFKVICQFNKTNNLLPQKS